MDEQRKPMGPAPGFPQSPGYRVDMEPCPKRIRVKIGGEFIADSTNALCMLETNHLPIYYFPRAGVRMDFLVRTEHTSF